MFQGSWRCYEVPGSQNDRMQKSGKDVKIRDNQVCNNHIWEFGKKESPKGRSTLLDKKGRKSVLKHLAL